MAEIDYDDELIESMFDNFITHLQTSTDKSVPNVTFEEFKEAFLAYPELEEHGDIITNIVYERTQAGEDLGEEGEEYLEDGFTRTQLDAYIDYILKKRASVKAAKASKAIPKTTSTISITSNKITNDYNSFKAQFKEELDDPNNVLYGVSLEEFTDAWNNYNNIAKISKQRILDDDDYRSLKDHILSRREMADVDQLSNRYLTIMTDEIKRIFEDADDIESLSDWIDQTFTNDPNVEYLKQAIQYLNLEDAKLWIIYYIKNTLINTFYDNYPGALITVWGLANTPRTPLTTVFFGKPKEKLPIDVIRPDKKQFTHELSENFAYGLIVGLQDENFLLAFNGVRLEVIPDYYALPGSVDDLRTYTATVNGNQYFFDDLEFLKGLVTSARWLNFDKNDFITNFAQLELNEDGDDYDFIELDF